jgi:hypothetical protein
MYTPTVTSDNKFKTFLKDCRMISPVYTLVCMEHKSSDEDHLCMYCSVQVELNGLSIEHYY